MSKHLENGESGLVSSLEDRFIRWHQCEDENNLVLDYMTTRHKYEAIHRLCAGRVLIMVTQAIILPAWQPECCTNGHGQVKSGEPHALFCVNSEGQTRGAAVKHGIIHCSCHAIASFYCPKPAKSHGSERCAIAERSSIRVCSTRQASG